MPKSCTERHGSTSQTQNHFLRRPAQRRTMFQLCEPVIKVLSQGCDKVIVPWRGGFKEDLGRKEGAAAASAPPPPPHKRHQPAFFSLSLSFSENGLLPRAITLIEGVVLHQPSPLIQPLTTLDAGCCSDHIRKRKKKNPNRVDQL